MVSTSDDIPAVSYEMNSQVETSNGEAPEREHERTKAGYLSADAANLNAEDRSDEKIEDEIIEFASSIRFHQRFSFVCKTTQSRLHVTYSISGATTEDAPVMLVVPGMFGGRYIGLWIDYLAAKEGVKVIVVDR